LIVLSNASSKKQQDEKARLLAHHTGCRNVKIDYRDGDISEEEARKRINALNAIPISYSPSLADAPSRLGLLRSFSFLHTNVE
jgi:hypothetical protein